MTILRAQILHIPCVCFGVKARFTYGGGEVTPIEHIALQAIGLGFHEVESLEEILGLGKRPVLDLIYDAWLKGYITIDTTHGHVHLAGEAAAAFASGNLEQLGTMENKIETVMLMQELVSGAILPHIGPSRPRVQESSLVPTLETALDLHKISPTEIQTAVQSWAKFESTRRERDLQLLEVWPDYSDQSIGGSDSTADGGIAVSRSIMTVFADIQYDAASKRLMFEIVESSELPPTVRRRVSRALSDLADKMSAQTFFRRIFREFENSPTASEPIYSAGAVIALQKKCSRLDTVDRGLVERRHHELRKDLELAIEEVSDSVRSDAAIQIVVGYDQHEEEIRRLLDSSQNQVIMGNPWIQFEALLDPVAGQSFSWFDLLESALRRNVKVFLFWGIASRSTLDDKVASALSDLQARYPGRLWLSRKSSTSHAKFVIRDVGEALITSFNFLQPSRSRDSLEIGLLVRARHQQVVPEAILDLLEWSRGAFPDHLMAKRILLLPEDFGARDPEMPAFPEAPEAPLSESSDPANGVEPAAIRHWADSWRGVARQMCELSDQVGSDARLLVDRAHRDALLQAARTSQHRFAVLSDRVSVDVITDNFAKSIEARLTAEVPCLFLYRREGASDRTEGPAERLRRLARRWPESCTLIEAPSHAKLLISDDQVTVGSFNFLSFGGEYASSQQERAELSLCVRDPQIVDQILSVLDQHWPGSFAPLRGLGRDTSSSPPANVAPALQPLFRAMHSPDRRGAELLHWFEQSDNPWADLRGLEQVGLPNELLTTAAAAALARCPSLDDEDAKSWRRRLALWRWDAQDFVAAAVLLPDNGSSLSPELAEFVAAVFVGPAADIEVPASLTGLKFPELDAFALSLLVAILVHGRFDLLPTFREIEQFSDGTTRRWIAACIHYAEETQQALPLELLRRSSDHEQRRSDIARAKSALELALSDAENITFRFSIGGRIWAHLRQSGQVLGELRSAVERNDPESMAKFVDGNEGLEARVGAWIDDASSKVENTRNGVIDGRKRRTCIHRMVILFKAARAWLELSRCLESAAIDDRISNACHQLRRDLDGLQFSEAYESDPVLGAVLRRTRAELAPLFGGSLP